MESLADRESIQGSPPHKRPRTEQDAGDDRSHTQIQHGQAPQLQQQQQQQHNQQNQQNRYAQFQQNPYGQNQFQTPGMVASPYRPPNMMQPQGMLLTQPMMPPQAIAQMQNMGQPQISFQPQPIMQPVGQPPMVMQPYGQQGLAYFKYDAAAPASIYGQAWVQQLQQGGVPYGMQPSLAIPPNNMQRNPAMPPNNMQAERLGTPFVNLQQQMPQMQRTPQSRQPSSNARATPVQPTPSRSSEEYRRYVQHATTPHAAPRARGKGLVDISNLTVTDFLTGNGPQEDDEEALEDILERRRRMEMDITDVKPEWTEPQTPIRRRANPSIIIHDTPEVIDLTTPENTKKKTPRNARKSRKPKPTPEQKRAGVALNKIAEAVKNRKPDADPFVDQPITGPDQDNDEPSGEKPQRKSRITDTERRIREEQEANRLEEKRVRSLKFSDREQLRFEELQAIFAEERRAREEAMAKAADEMRAREEADGGEQPSQATLQGDDADQHPEDNAGPSIFLPDVGLTESHLEGEASTSRAVRDNAETDIIEVDKPGEETTVNAAPDATDSIMISSDNEDDNEADNEAEQTTERPLKRATGRIHKPLAGTDKSQEEGKPEKLFIANETGLINVFHRRTALDTPQKTAKIRFKPLNTAQGAQSGQTSGTRGHPERLEDRADEGQHRAGSRQPDTIGFTKRWTRDEIMAPKRRGPGNGKKKEQTAPDKLPAILQPDPAGTSSRARKGWVGAKESEKLQQEFRKAIEIERRKVEKERDDMRREDEQRREEWEVQQEQRSHEWSAQMAQVNQMSNLLAGKVDASLEGALKKALENVLPYIPFAAAQANVNVNFRGRPRIEPTSAVTFLSAANIEAEKERQAKQARERKYEKAKNSQRRRYEREIRQALESQEAQPNDEKIEQTVNQKMELWEVRYRKKYMKQCGDNTPTPAENSQGTNAANPPGEPETPTNGPLDRESLTKQALRSLGIRHSPNSDFARAASKTTVAQLGGVSDDESIISEEDPDDDDDEVESPTKQLSAPQAEDLADRLVEVPRDKPLDPSTLPALPEPQEQQNQDIVAFKLPDFKEEDMLHTYTVKHVSCRDDAPFGASTKILQTFHSLHEANSWASEQLDGMYLSVEKQTNVGRKEVYDADGLFRGSIALLDLEGWEEMIWVTMDITYKGELVNVDHDALAQSKRVPSKVYVILKMVVVHDKDGNPEASTDIVATTSIVSLANKIASETYLELAAPVSAQIDKVRRYREVVKPQVEANRRKADEEGVVIELEEGKNDEKGPMTFSIRVDEVNIRGPVN